MKASMNVSINARFVKNVATHERCMCPLVDVNLIQAVAARSGRHGYFTYTARVGTSPTQHTEQKCLRAERLQQQQTEVATRIVL